MRAKETSRVKAFLLSFRQTAAGILMVDQIQICQIKKICPTFSLMDERERKREKSWLMPYMVKDSLNWCLAECFPYNKASLNTTLLKALQINPACRYWGVITGACLGESVYIRRNVCELVGLIWFYLHKLDIQFETECYNSLLEWITQPMIGFHVFIEHNM